MKKTEDPDNGKSMNKTKIQNCNSISLANSSSNFHFQMVVGYNGSANYDIWYVLDSYHKLSDSNHILCHRILISSMF